MMRPRLSSVGAGSPRPRRIFKPVERLRISQLLDSAHAYGVTVLLAGAGYGKSVALDHWLARQAERLIRYDVLEGSRGVFDFALGLATALAPITKLGTRAAANAITTAEKSPMPDIDLATWFANALRRFRGTIVIDDFHVAAADDARVSKLMARVIERSGEHVRWVISSRAACGLPITSWIAYGQSQMAIGERELSFTHDEATATSEHAGSRFSSAQLNELFTYTAGWPTAMAFAILTAEHTLDLQELRASTQELSYQYLAEQVLRGLPDADAQFFLATSVYDRIDLAVLTHADFKSPRARMQFLKEQGTFIVLDAVGGIRYHDLFRDFLRSELAKSDDSFKSAWGDAAHTHERLGQLSKALSAFENASDLGGVTRLLESHGFGLIERGERSGVVRALEFLGRTLDFHAHPIILALRANCEANVGDPLRADALYNEAIAHSQDPVQNAEIRLQFARDLMQQIRPGGLDVLEPTSMQNLPVALKSSIMGTLAIHYWQAGRQSEALSMIERALSASAHVLDNELRAVLLHQSAYLRLLSGHAKEARDRAMEALELARASELHGLCARIQSVLFYLSTMVENVPEALWWAKQMERSATDAGDMLLLFSAVIASYDLEVERGNQEAITRLSEQLRPFDADRYARARLALPPAFALQAAWQRRFDEALRILSESPAPDQTSLRRALRAAEVALYSAAAGKRAEAESLCQYAQEQLRCNEGGEPYAPKRHAKALVWIGLSQLLLGKVSTANRSIGDAEKLGNLLPDRSKALVRAARAMFVHLETRALEHEVHAAFAELEQNSYAGVARMLRALPMPTLKREGTSAILTRTEVEVLRALERCGESKLAAAELGKSSQTVDWHVKSIKKKLGVKTRREAILFARDRGLIG